MSTVPLEARDRRFAWIAFCLVSAWFLSWAQPSADVIDAEVAHQAARSLRREGTLAMGDSPEARALVAHAEQAAPGASPLARGADGRWRSWYAPGQAVLLAPLHLVGEGLAHLDPRPDSNGSARVVDGVVRSEWWPHAATSWANPLCAGALAGLAYLVARRLGASRGSSAWAVVGLCFASFLAPLARGQLSDVPAALFLCLGFERWLAARAGDPRALPWCGFALGLACATRVQLAPAAVVLAASAAWSAPHRVAAAVRLVPGFAAGALLVALANHARGGSPFDFGYASVFAGGFFARNPLEGAWLLVSSPGRGLWWSAPVLLPAVLGWWRWHARDATGAAALFVAALLVAAPVCAMVAWHGAHAHGPRYVLASVVLLAPCAALCFDHAGAWVRRAWRAMLVAAAALQLCFLATDAASWHAAAIEAQRRLAPELGREGADPVVRDEALFQSALVDWRTAAPTSVPRYALAQFAADAEGAIDAERVFPAAGRAAYLPPERARHGRFLALVDAEAVGAARWPLALLVALFLGVGAWLAARTLKERAPTGR
jgi:hypothetical protein